MKLIKNKNKSKWQIVGDGGHVYHEFKTKRDAIARLICMEKDMNSCRSPQHMETYQEIKERILKKYED